MPIHAPVLKYFREVVASGSVRTAARRLHISTSAVNRQILKIEDELGVSLFERKPGGMVLTTAGHVLAGHVERTLVDAERCHAEIAALGQVPDRPLTIAGQESVIAEFLPPVLVELHAALPGMGSAFVAAGGDQLNWLLLDGTADVAIAFDVELGQAPPFDDQPAARRRLPDSDEPRASACPGRAQDGFDLLEKRLDAYAKHWAEPWANPG